MKKHDILLFSPSFEDPGGVAAFCRLLMNHVSSEFKVDHFEIGNRPGNRNPLRQVSFFIADTLRLARRLRKERYDLIHLNPSLEILSLVRDSFYLWLISRIFKTKTLVLFHGWNSKIARQIAKNRLCRRLFRSLYGKAGRILVLCRSYRDQLEGMGLSPARIDVITTMFQAEDVLGGEPKADPRAPVQILFMARLLKSKGVYIAADVGRILVEKGMRNFRLIFAGDGPELEGIRRFRNEFGLENYIHTLGYLRNEEKRDVLGKSDIFLYPTYGEGCPIVVLEAMGAGLAIVSTPVGAIPEVVEDGRNGFLIGSRIAKDFLPYIERLIADPSLLSRMRAVNKKKALANFEARIITRKMESIYSLIIQDRAAARQSPAGQPG